MTDAEPVEERLARLADGTQGLRPTPGFEQRVNQAIFEQTRAGPFSDGAPWLGSIVRPGRWVLAAAAATTVAAILFALQSQQSFDRQAAVSYASLEVEW
jgi:hypothetical protein